MVVRFGRRILLAALVAFTWPPAAPAGAAELSVAVAPSRYVASLDSGQSRDGFIDVFNEGARAILVEPRLELVSQAGRDGATRFESLPAGDDAHRLVRYDPEPFRVEPGVAQRVPFRIAVTDAIAPGGYVLALTFRASDVRATGARGGVRQSGRIGTIFVLTVGDGAPASARIERLDTDASLLADSRSMTVRVRNAGRERDAVLDEAVTVTVRRTLPLPGGGAQVATVEPGLVLPGSERDARVRLTSTWWFGRYEATSRVGGHGGDVESVTFWAISYRCAALLAVVAAAMVGSLALRIQRRRLLRWADLHSDVEE